MPEDNDHDAVSLPAAGLVALFVLAGIAVLVASYGAYHFFAGKLIDRAKEDLQSLNEVKTAQIRAMLDNWHRDLELFVVRPDVWKSAAGIDVTQELPRVNKALSDIIRIQGYRYVLLADAAFRVVAPNTLPQIDEDELPTLQKAGRVRDLVLVDLHSEGSTTVFGLAHPVFLNGDHNADSPVVGVAHFEQDAEKILFPILEARITSSATTETLLARRDGSEVVFLSHLRFKPEVSPLSFRLPVGGPPTLIKRALLAGEFGLRMGKDYRSVDVVGCVQRIPNTPWVIMTKVDRSEIEYPAKVLGVAIFTVALILMLLLGAVFWLFWRRQALAARVERSAITERYAMAIATSIDGYMLVDTTGRIIDANAALSGITGYDEAELKTLLVPDLEVLETPGEVRAHMARIMASGKDSFTSQWKRKDGRVIDIQSNVSFSNHHLFVFVQDITERKTLLEALHNQFTFQRALVETIPLPIFYKGPDTRFLGCNRAYEEAFGVCRTDIVGERVLDLAYLPESERTLHQTEDEAIIKQCGSLQREMRIPLADGQWHDTLYCISGFRHDDDRPRVLPPGEPGKTPKTHFGAGLTGPFDVE